MNPKSGAVDSEAARFRSTHWSIVFGAAQDHTPAGQAALAELYRIYWYPLYSHVRRRGYSPEDSKDLTQNFFLHLLEHRRLTQVDPQKGRFRSFLLASLQNFLSTAHRREQTIKRGGLCAFISLDAAKERLSKFLWAFCRVQARSFLPLRRRQQSLESAKPR